jgi:hypothetical protein
MFKASADAAHESQGFSALLVVELVQVIMNSRNYAWQSECSKTLLFDVSCNDVGDMGAWWEHS